MEMILVSDVFGVTPALLDMANKLKPCIIVDPYEGQMMDFQNEKEAYAYFVKAVGLDNFLSILNHVLLPIEHPVSLVGFSVGASVIWRLSAIQNGNFIKQAFCYYGSQIRNFTEVEPNFPIQMILPRSEPHFDVTKLQNHLSLKSNVITRKVNYLHGFMNYFSNNYNQIGYLEHIDILCSKKSK